MDPIALMIQQPLLVLAIAVAVYVVLHLTVIRGLGGPQAPVQPSSWVIRPAAEGPDSYEVLIQDAGQAKIPAIKLVRTINGLGLKEAKELVEAAPQRVKVLHGRHEADRVAEAIQREGARVTVE
ncbi:MAG: ribosomal protein L7/L12 [Candidatus Sericytochromatia bacterium]